MGSEVRRTRVLIPALLLNNCVNLDPWLASVGLFSQVKMGVIPLNSVVAASSRRGNQCHRCPSFRMEHTVRPVAIDYGGIVPTRLIGIIVPEFAMSTVPLSSLQAGEARQVGYSGGRQGGTLQTPCPAGPCHLQLAVRGPGHDRVTADLGQDLAPTPAPPCLLLGWPFSEVFSEGCSPESPRPSWARMLPWSPVAGNHCPPRPSCPLPQGQAFRPGVPTAPPEALFPVCTSTAAVLGWGAAAACPHPTEVGVLQPLGPEQPRASGEAK